jgi:ankyrin repeat protein
MQTNLFSQELDRLIGSRSVSLEAKDSEGCTALHIAAKFGQDQGIRKLLTGANVAATDKWQWTPVFWVAYHNRVEALRILLDQGADINLQNCRAKTPLCWAAQCANEAAVELLIKNSVDRIITDAEGKVAKDWASTAGIRELFDSIPPPQQPRQPACSRFF